MTAVFISYTHADEALKVQFLQHLAPLHREGLISIWHDRMLNPGDHLNHKIQQELAASSVIILLVSAAFLASEYCYEEEMRKAFARRRAGQAQVVAVILRPCQWQNVPVGEGMMLKDFLAVPRDAKPVTKWADWDEAFDDAAAAIRRLLLHGRARKVATPAAAPAKIAKEYDLLAGYPKRSPGSSPARRIPAPENAAQRQERLLRADTFRGMLRQNEGRWEIELEEFDMVIPFIPPPDYEVTGGHVVISGRVSPEGDHPYVLRAAHVLHYV